MDIKLALMANGDDVVLTWRPVGDTSGCFGFAIERKRNGGAIEVLKNRVSDKDHPAPKERPQDLLNPSTQFPFRSISWTDHGVDAGDKVSYRVVAMMGTLSNLQRGAESDWSEEIALTNTYGPVSAYFNRGLVISQFASRVMREHGWDATALKQNVRLVDNQFRRFLSGQLRTAMLQMLNAAARDPEVHLYAALFELSDEELLDGLVALGPRLHIVLANGAVKTRGQDENGEARETLRAAGCEVFDRMCAPTFLGHNKFVVVTRGEDQPLAVWTGSTNWQPTGLCTQMNNGVLIESPAAAKVYLTAWARLRDAGDKHTDALLNANSRAPQEIGLSQESTLSARFTAVRKGVDLAELKALVGQAQSSVLFAMFMPGADIYEAVMAKRATCFVRGVANTFPRNSGADEDPVQDLDEGTVDVKLADNRRDREFRLAAVQPEGIPHAIGNWVAEITRRQFSAIGHAIVHSKVIVIDADTANPCVVTGSHNLSTTASKSNDENFVVIRGNAPLAMAYAVMCLALYDHYR